MRRYSCARLCQVFSSKFLSPISGSKSGLRTRVYTQGLDNDRLEVDINSVDFSSISSNEGAILCSIKYDGKDIIDIMNSYLTTKITRQTGYNIFEKEDIEKIKNKSKSKYKKEILEKTLFCGNIPYIEWMKIFVGDYQGLLIQQNIFNNIMKSYKKPSYNIMMKGSNNLKDFEEDKNPPVKTQQSTALNSSRASNSSIASNLERAPNSSRASTFLNNTVYNNAQSGRESTSSISSNNAIFSNTRNNL